MAKDNSKNRDKILKTIRTCYDNGIFKANGNQFLPSCLLPYINNINYSDLASELAKMEHDGIIDRADGREPGDKRGGYRLRDL